MKVELVVVGGAGVVVVVVVVVVLDVMGIATAGFGTSEFELKIGLVILFRNGEADTGRNCDAMGVGAYKA